MAEDVLFRRAGLHREPHAGDTCGDFILSHIEKMGVVLSHHWSTSPSQEAAFEGYQKKLVTSASVLDIQDEHLEHNVLARAPEQLCLPFSCMFLAHKWRLSSSARLLLWLVRGFRWSACRTMWEGVCAHTHLRSWIRYFIAGCISLCTWRPPWGVATKEQPLKVSGLRLASSLRREHGSSGC